jgi:RNA polymerase sigma factor (sigma-70 family)
MGADRELRQETLDALLDWLDPDRDLAAIKYENARRALVMFFSNRGCAEAEDLADEIINRVALKARKLQKTYVGEPGKYFHRVARFVHLEYLRRRGKFEPLPDNLSAGAGTGAYDETAHRCLERCLRALDPDQRELVSRYYSETRPEQHAELARALETNVRNLRVKVFRIVQKLRACVKKCIEQGGG